MRNLVFKLLLFVSGRKSEVSPKPHADPDHHRSGPGHGRGHGGVRERYRSTLFLLVWESIQTMS